MNIEKAYKVLGYVFITSLFFFGFTIMFIIINDKDFKNASLVDKMFYGQLVSTVLSIIWIIFKRNKKPN